jgi:selenium metabolism protein YedF
LSINKDLLLVLESSGLGDGEPDLGEKLMRAFLTVLFESGEIPSRIICLNSGIFLTTVGSPVGDILKRYEELGSRILSCGTCLDYYGRKDKILVGESTNMKDTVSALLTFKKILRP